MAQPMPMETIIQRAKEQGFEPLRYPTGELLQRRCPECLVIGALAIFRHQTDDSLMDIYACSCGFRRWSD